MNTHGRKLYSNIPQSIVGYQIEGGKFEQGDSLDSVERYRVLNILGDQVLKIEVSSEIKIKNNQTLLLGSDGLLDNFFMKN